MAQLASPAHAENHAKGPQNKEAILAASFEELDVPLSDMFRQFFS
jgi:hypothetical protein